MKEPAATATIAVVALILLILSSVFIKRAASRPPSVLLSAGVAFLALAAVYVTIASLLRPGQQLGLWAPGLATSVPTALSSAGTTAVSVWVALWAADQSRVSKFVADESALIRQLDGALRLLERRSIWLRDFWIGPTSPAVRAGEEMLTRFRLGEIGLAPENYDLFGPSGMAQKAIESLFGGFSDRTMQDHTEALRDATRRLVGLEIDTGLPMQPLLADMEFFEVVSSSLNEASPAPVAGSLDALQRGRAKSLLRVQLLVLLATCYEHASVGVGEEQPTVSMIEEFMASQGQWWQKIFSSISERPATAAIALRQRLGKSPLTGYEAIKAVPADELREADRLWCMFILAHLRRNDVLKTVRVFDSEHAGFRSFGQLSHMLFWQKIRQESHLDDVSHEGD